jgi:hypothetical protein
MESLQDRAKRWRARAEELRIIAETMESPAKQHLLDAARDWVDMAEQAERLAGPKPSP